MDVVDCTPDYTWLTPSTLDVNRMGGTYTVALLDPVPVALCDSTYEFELYFWDNAYIKPFWIK